LYARLQSDLAFNTLMAHLFFQGCGIYWFAHLEPEGVEGTLQDIVERHRAALGPEPESRRWFTEFLAEVERTRADFPGIEQRMAMLENCSLEVEERLTQALRKVRTDADEFTQKLLFGDKQLAPHLGQPEEEILGLISQPLVREGAATLERLKPRKLFPSDTWCRENYSEWRETYLGAAEHAEELLVGVS
jgi:hypothetical protein